jgi:hypothetical protein
MDNIERKPHIPPQVVETYKVVTFFKEGRHHMYVQEKNDPDQQWLPTQYRLTKDNMSHIMIDLDDEWNISPIETRPSKKQKPQVHKINEDEEGGDD